MNDAIRRHGPVAAIVVMAANLGTLVVMHAVRDVPLHPDAWTNVAGTLGAALSLGLMRSGRSRIGVAALLLGVVTQGLADLALAPSPTHASLPFAPLVVAATGVLFGLGWSVALAAVYAVLVPGLVFAVPHAQPLTVPGTVLVTAVVLAVLVAPVVAWLAHRLSLSLVSQADAAAARARRLIERAPDAIVVVGADGRVVESNEATQRLFAPHGLAAGESLPARLMRHDGTLADAAFLRGATTQLLRGRVIGTDHEVAITGATLEDAGAEPSYELMLRVVAGAQRAVAARDAHPAADSPMRVLLVDDDDMVRAALGMQLTRAGCKVTAVAEGDAALAEVRTRGREFDVLLSDVVMPGMSGPDLVRHARALQPGLPVVLMSGDPRHLLHGLDVPGPAWAFIAKPFMLPQLEAAFAKAGATAAPAH